MKGAKFVIEPLLACIALLTIFIYRGVVQDIYAAKFLGVKEYIYFVVLIVSVVFMHRLMIRVVLPWNVLSAEQKNELQEQGRKHYNQSFFKGIIALGYFFVVFDICKVVVDVHLIKTGAGDVVRVTNDLPMALVFILIGVASKARGMILYLCQK